MLGLGPVRPDDDALTCPSSCRTATTRCCRWTGMPAPSTRSRNASHICPGPRRGYRNSSISVVTCSRRSPIRPEIAWTSEKFLIRCAAHSRRISEPGIPHTFSRVGAKERVVEALSEPARHPVLERLAARAVVSARPQVRHRAQRRLDHPQPRDHVPRVERVVRGTSAGSRCARGVAGRGSPRPACPPTAA